MLSVFVRSTCASLEKLLNSTVQTELCVSSVSRVFGNCYVKILKQYMVAAFLFFLTYLCVRASVLFKKSFKV